MRVERPRQALLYPFRSPKLFQLLFSELALQFGNQLFSESHLKNDPRNTGLAARGRKVRNRVEHESNPLDCVRGFRKTNFCHGLLDLLTSSSMPSMQGKGLHLRGKCRRTHSAHRGDPELFGTLSNHRHVHPSAGFSERPHFCLCYGSFKPLTTRRRSARAASARRSSKQTMSIGSPSSSERRSAADSCKASAERSG